MKYDCQECGACCIDYFGTEGYIELAPAEEARMGRLGLPVVAWHGQRLLATRRHDGPIGDRCCVAFEGRVGEWCGCSIYDHRPRACRKFEAGSEGCRFARAEAGLPV